MSDELPDDLNALLADAGVEVAPPLTREEKVDLLFQSAADGFEDENAKLSVEEFVAVEPALILSKDARGWTPVVVASFSGRPDVVEVLLANNNDSKYTGWLAETQIDMAEDAAVPDGAKMPVNSPLHWASFKGHLNTVWTLLQHGFVVDDCDSCGNTALHLAAAGGHAEVVKVLMAFGVNLALANFYGNTALDLASNAETRSLLKAAASQPRCAATSIAFGPDQLFYRCTCCGKGFTEEASEGLKVPAIAGQAIQRPVRYDSECLFKIQEAEAALEAIIDPAKAAAAAAAAAAVSDSPTPASPTAKSSHESKLEETKGMEDGDGEAEEEKAADGDSDGKLDLHGLQQALGAVESLGGDVNLIAQAHKVVRRETSANALAEQLEVLESKRPLTRRGATTPLFEAINVAREAYVDIHVLNAAERVLQSALAEVRLLGSVTICRNIKLATHAHDGDLKRLRDAVDAVRRFELGGELADEAAHLSTRLDAEVHMSDGLEACDAAVAEALRRATKYAGEDPTDLPMLPLEEGEETPKRSPTKIQRALDRLLATMKDLEQLAEKAGEVSADEALIEAARAKVAEAQVQLDEQQEIEDARVAKMEAERAKRDRKNKKKGKGKGKGKKK